MTCFEEVISSLIPVKLAAARIVHTLVTAPPMEISIYTFEYQDCPLGFCGVQSVTEIGHDSLQVYHFFCQPSYSYDVIHEVCNDADHG